jgi:Tfp pilus assembly protein PilN
LRAVNLIPADARRGGAGAGALRGPGYIVLGVLGLALVLVTIYVLTSNTVSERKVKLASLQQQVAQEQAVAASLSSYTQFERLAQARAETVREIAGSRFDWHAVLSDLSKVVPANTSLQSLLATVAPGAAVSGPGGSTSASGLRGDVSAPAFELTGCTHTQDQVAQLMSRLRLINGVTRVTLSNSVKQDTGSGLGAAVAKSGSNVTAGCGQNTPTFDLIVFFEPLPGAGPAGVTAVTTSTAGGGGAK